MAGTTPTFGLPYPTGQDLVRDGDNAIQALAEAVEATVTRVWTGVVGLTGGANTPRVTSVTFPTGLFPSLAPAILIDSRTATSNASTTNTEIWSQSASINGCQICVNRSNTTGVEVFYAAIQQGPAVTDPLPQPRTLGAAAPYADTPLGPMLRPTYVTCDTVRCPNQGAAILMDLGWLDEDGTTVHAVDHVVCGVCGVEITDLAPYAPDDGDDGEATT